MSFREIPLTQGFVTVVDDADWEMLSEWKWCVQRCRPRKDGSRRCYAIRNRRGGGGSGVIAMHRIVACAPDGLVVDHKNGDGLDNRRGNLRVCSQLQNSWNRRPSDGRYKGVERGAERTVLRWRATIAGKCLGRFLTEHDAARAYNAAAIKEWGEFAWLNDVREGSQLPWSVERDESCPVG